MLSWNVRLTYERYQQEDIIAARFVEKLIEQNSVEEKDLFPGAFFYAFLQWLCWQYVAGNRPAFFIFANFENKGGKIMAKPYNCLLYTSDAADDLLCVDLGGRRIIKKKNKLTNCE